MADEALIRALACGATVENAARKAGMGERTAYRRLENPEFGARVNAARAEVVERITGLLTGGGLLSVKTLIDLQQDAATSPSVRRGAARDVLAMGIRYRDQDLEARVAELENRMRNRSE